VILTGATVITQAFGVVRVLFLASAEGASGSLDALLIALALPGVVAGVITSGAATALVPAYMQARLVGGRAGARRLAGLLLTWAAIGGTVLGLLLIAGASLIIALAGPGLQGADRAASIDYLRLFALLTPILCVSSLLGAVLQAEQRFVTLAISGITGSATTLALLMLLWETFGLEAFAWSSVAGPVVALAVLLAGSVRASIAPAPVLFARGLGVRAFVRHALPLSASSAILQVNVVIESAIANLVGPGGVSILRYAEVLIRTPIAAVGPAWGTAIYPSLVDSTTNAGEIGLARTTMLAARFAGAVFVPVAALTAALAPILVAVAYLRGAFTPEAVSATASVVAAFAPLMVVLIISPVLTGALNALRRGMVLLAGGVLNVAINTFLAPTLAVVLGLGVTGIAVSASTTPIVVTWFFARRLARSQPDFVPTELGHALLRACIAALPPALICAGIAWNVPLPTDPIAGLAVLTTLTIPAVLAYILLATRLGLSEPMTVLKFLWRRSTALLQRGRPASAP
jgi:putative peptidoglycan lipid II flippase